MRDHLGREIDYLRLSITDRCNLRCVYCMPEEGVQKLPQGEILSYEEILRLCGAFAALGITKIKVTGGEPLVRQGCPGLIARLKALPGIRQVTLTTNGTLLAEQAAPLAAAGLDGVNISLDTTHRGRYRVIARRDALPAALAGVEAALAAGLRVKLNCVPLGVAEDVLALAELARTREIAVRFIELMPIGPGAELTGMDNREVLAALEAVYGPMTPWETALGNGPARYGAFEGFLGKIGFISAMGDCFCPGCNRVRLSAGGVLGPCLCSAGGTDLRPALARPGEDALLDSIREAIFQKPQRHSFSKGVAAGCPTMSQVGG